MVGTLQISIIEAEKLDDDTVRQLINLVNAAYHRHEWLFPNDRLMNTAEFHEETAGKELVLLTGASGKLVGSAMIYPEEDYLYLGMAAVELTQQSQGYGAQLLQVIAEIARQRKLARLKLIS